MKTFNCTNQTELTRVTVYFLNHVSRCDAFLIICFSVVHRAFLVSPVILIVTSGPLVSVRIKAEAASCPLEPSLLLFILEGLGTWGTVCWRALPSSSSLSEVEEMFFQIFISPQWHNSSYCHTLVKNKILNFLIIIPRIQKWRNPFYRACRAQLAPGIWLPTVFILPSFRY